MSSSTSIPPVRTSDSVIADPTSVRNKGDSPGHWIGFGVANLVVVAVLSVATWYLLADPVRSPWHFYPLPFNAALFWAILFIVFIVFNAGFSGFNRLPQPGKGCAITVTTAVFAVIMTWLLSEGLGHIDPDFSVGRAGGLGFFAGALFVLFGFSTFVMVVLNWGHWPWPQLGLTQPRVGLAEIAAVMGPTMLLYFVFGLPSVSLAATHPLMSVDTVLGLFYSFIVSVILTGQSLDNWPWRLAGSPARIALASTVGNVVVGACFYFVAVPFIKVLFGSLTTDALGNTIHQYPAQLGVCWAFWMIFWANAFGNRPTGLGMAANYAIRTLLTFVLAVASFVFYFRFAAGSILHEPSAGPGIHGNALGFIDWLVLWTLLYVVGFESWGLRRWLPAHDSDSAA